jgi:hypothetical protein
MNSVFTNSPGLGAVMSRSAFLQIDAKRMQVVYEETAAGSVGQLLLF